MNINPNAARQRVLDALFENDIEPSDQLVKMAVCGCSFFDIIDDITLEMMSKSRTISTDLLYDKLRRQFDAEEALEDLMLLELKLCGEE